MHGPFSGIAPELDLVTEPADRGGMLRDVLKKTLEIPYQLEVFQGELLYEVTRNKHWRDWFVESDSAIKMKYASFEEYVETELGFKRRKAYDLIDIYRTFIVDLELPIDKLKEISWSKARLVTKIVDKDNVEAILEEIEPMTVREVKSMVAEIKADDPTLKTTTYSDEDDFVRVLLMLAPLQAENLHHALETASKISGSEKPSNNIDLICTDFLSSTAATGVEGALIKLDAAKSAIERAFGVKLEIKEMDEERFEKIESMASEV